MAAPWAYFDTSILVKRYLNERGSLHARILMRQYRCLTSELTPVEAVSVLSRRRVLGDLSERAFAALVSRIRTDRERWELVAVSDLVLRKAEEVIQDSGAKTLDAIHIASALLFQANSGIRIAFLSADEKQLNAAAACGLPVERGRTS